jgi:hypothetical protein
MRIVIALFTFLILPLTSFCQLTLRTAPHQYQGNTNPMARVQGLTPLTLPFWDDFSYYTNKWPIDSLWQSYSTVTITDGMAVNPVSLKVATFDGYGADGKPYKSGTDILAKGLADDLISRPIDLTKVAPEKRSTVYLSFYYQAQGNGEVPDSGDRLIVYFKSLAGWEEIEVIESINPTSFTFKSILVDTRFFHSAFQFRIRNFGRLSGPYDTWNIDYVYMNVDRTPTDFITPDRTIATPLTSLFANYWSIPYSHFKVNPTANLIDPTLRLFNLKNGPQPINYGFSTNLTYYKGTLPNSVQSKTDTVSISDNLNSREWLIVPIKSDIKNFVFDKQADSLLIKLNIGIKSGDNVAFDPDPKKNGGDYTSNYFPINFKNNDFTSASYNLSTYYAYDDGEAEYGAGVNQAGAELAYLFNLTTTEPDVLRKIDIYFPDFGDQSSQIMELRIWKTLDDASPVILYKQTVPVKRSAKSKFVSYDLDPTQPVTVQGSFYVGWRQINATRIDVGFDANSDSGDKIFYNTTGTWTKNTYVKGSLMIRPVFGGGSPITNVMEEKEELFLYPNPNEGTFYIPANASQLSVHDLLGNAIDFQVRQEDSKTSVTINNGTGLFIIKFLLNNEWFAQRIIIN